jgi:hypothetical protein
MDRSPHLISAVNGVRRFEHALEKAYQADLVHEKMRVFVLVDTLCVVLYLAFAYLDVWALPNSFISAWGVRAAVVGATVFTTVIAWSEREAFQRHYAVVVSALFLTWGIGIECIILLAAPGDLAWHAYYAGLLLVTMGLYTCTYLGPAHACVVGFVITFTYIVVAVFGQHMVEGADRAALLGNCFFLLSANVIGIVALDTRERFARKAFLLERARRGEPAADQ